MYFFDTSPIFYDVRRYGVLQKKIDVLKKYLISFQNPKRLDFDFNENHMLPAKTAKKLIFLCESNFMPRLDAKVSYIKF
jgi:hypothetical protein